MGFMTEVCISNDAWHVMRDNPDEFIGAISVGMNARCIDSYGIQNYVNYLKVAPSHHADDPRLYLAWRGSFVDMSKWGLQRDYSNRLDDQIIIDFMEQNIREAQRQLTELKKFVEEQKVNK